MLYLSMPQAPCQRKTMSTDRTNTEGPQAVSELQSVAYSVQMGPGASYVGLDLGKMFRLPASWSTLCKRNSKKTKKKNIEANLDARQIVTPLVSIERNSLTRLLTSATKTFPYTQKSNIILRKFFLRSKYSVRNYQYRNQFQKEKKALKLASFLSKSSGEQTLIICRPRVDIQFIDGELIEAS